MILVTALAPGCKNRHNRPGDTLTCTPGESLSIGCTGAVGSTCDGDPVLDACDGSIPPSACNDASSFAMNDDASGRCPLVQTNCPSSGRITIQTHPYSTGTYQCYWDLVHGGGATPPDGGFGGGGG